MIIAGPCSYVDYSDREEIVKTARVLENTVDWFRCKLWLGGTRPDRYVRGIRSKGLPTLESINDFLPVMTEIQTEKHINKCKNLNGIWIGARSAQNYGLLEIAMDFKGEVFVKRGFGMTTDELIGLYDICKEIHKRKIYIIDRGINTFDRRPDSRWMPDIRNAIELKKKRPDVFDKLVIDCSHSIGKKNYIEDVYKSFYSIGCKHFMFECTYSGDSKTDKEQMLSVQELKCILR